MSFPYAKLRSDIKKSWLKALRSGNYEQCRKRLRHDDAYCCLGVLCDLRNADAWTKTSGGTWLYNFPTGVRNEETIPFEELFEMTLDSDARTALIDMNDDGKSFAEIADWIEAKL